MRGNGTGGAAAWAAVVVAVAAACQTSGSAARLPQLGGLAVYDRSLDRADRRVRAAWARVESVAADRMPSPPGGELAAYRKWAGEVLKPWVERHVAEMKELRGDLDMVAQQGARERLFAAAAMAHLYDDLLTQIRGLPAPETLAGDAAAASAFRAVLDAAVAPVAKSAREAYTACASAVRGAPDVMTKWKGRCIERAKALEDLAVAPPAPVAPPSPRSECETDEHWDDPQAPPGDPSAPAEIAVILDGNRFAPADAGRLTEAVGERLTRLLFLPLVPWDDVLRAQMLRDARKWTDDGPACGQAPPLPALLAATHKNLIVAAARTFCPPPSARLVAKPQPCRISVDFERPGASDGAGILRSLAAEVAGDAKGVEAWIAAAGALAPEPEGGLLGILGALGGGGSYFRVAGYADDDPWLRIAPTLHEQPFSRCWTAAGIASFKLSWTIGANGGVTAAEAEPIAAPAGAAGAVACVADVLRKTAFPCPRAGAPVSVEARVCVGGLGTAPRVEDALKPRPPR